MLLFFLSPAIADVARFIRVRISSVESPSEEMIDPRYLNDFTSLHFLRGLICYAYNFDLQIH